MKWSERGFSLIELMVVIGVMGILGAAGVIAVNQQLPQYRLSGDTRAIASSLMLARMKAISSGMQYAIQFDLDSIPQHYILQRGNANINSTSWSNDSYLKEISTGVNIERVFDNGNSTCSGRVRIIYNPNGSYSSSSEGKIRLRIGSASEGYQVIITPATGRVRTDKSWT